MDFHLSISGIHAELSEVHKEVLEFVEKLKALGVSVENASIGSGHLLGGAVSVLGSHDFNIVDRDPIKHESESPTEAQEPIQ